MSVVGLTFFVVRDNIVLQEDIHVK